MSVLKEHGFGIGNYWWILLIAALMVVGYFFLFTKLPNVFQMGKMKFPMLLYLSSITTHGLMGVAIMIFVPELFLLGFGSLLFFISDLVLTLDRFVFKNKWSLRANSAFYFTGMLLIVLSMVL